MGSHSYERLPPILDNVIPNLQTYFYVGDITICSGDCRRRGGLMAIPPNYLAEVTLRFEDTNNQPQLWTDYDNTSL